ncbi:hypothetical protein SAMN04488503_1704 [Humidesulfovibrio mexicanus]|uniref:Pentapeptide repeat-containing protein n=1 Tax=Humidesulfovibrio mexicanus TaxID=147047 RepID=A0A238ZZA7_9BACT|nr:hypothetical protein [Humidesulfovibrio mexicanus]SNR88361.1 hypothetical protein SAMN04488503_1704 [Humidesulfovibrio mexicanus]
MEGKCCKCEEYNWPDPQEVVWEDPVDGKGYCVFHAQKAETKLASADSAKPLTSQAFNKLVLDRMNNAVLSNEITCLKGVVFPWKFEIIGKNTNKRIVRADFSCALFCSSVRFYGVKFSDSEFKNAIFKDATFDYSEFESGCPKSESNGEFLFHGSKFVIGVFYNCIFQKVNFCEINVEERIHFKECSFNAEALFHGCSGKDKSILFSRVGAPTVPGHGSRNGGGNEVFMKNVIFRSHDVHWMSFSVFTWPMRLGYETYASTVQGDTVSPEEQVRKNKIHMKECEELYRAMKQRALELHDQPQASRWHFREKLMQLKLQLLPAKSNALVDAFEDESLCVKNRMSALWELFRALPWRMRRSLLFLYWISSGFGERSGRAAISLLALIVLSLLTLVVLKLFETGLSLRFDALKVGEVLYEWVRCMPLVKIDATINTSAPIVSGIRTIFSGLAQVATALQATLFALAVRNRFRR